MRAGREVSPVRIVSRSNSYGREARKEGDADQREHAGAYTESCLDAIEETKARTNGAYYPTTWKVIIGRRLGERGPSAGVEAAKSLLRQEGVAGDVDGGERLHAHRLDYLSVEWSVLNPRWAKLFTDEDRELAYAAFELNLREQGAQVWG